jgi:hypothetical protein
MLPFVFLSLILFSCDKLIVPKYNGLSLGCKMCGIIELEDVMKFSEGGATMVQFLLQNI